MGANRIDKRKHRLHVDVSWQIPQLNSSSNLKAFKLIVNGPDGRNTCFVFNVTQQPHKDEDNVAVSWVLKFGKLIEKLTP